MIIQIPIIAWIFLGEALTRQQIVGMAIAGVGMVLVQLRRNRHALETTPKELVVTT